MSEKSELEDAIAALEAQRAVLGDAVVDAAVGPMGEKLAALDAAVDTPADDGERKFVTMIFADLSGSTALGEVMVLARLSNGYFDAKQPWKQRKEDLAGCGTTLNVCIQTVKALATLMGPFLPFSAAKCADMLGIELDEHGTLAWAHATQELPADHALGEPAILFTKLDAADL